MMLHQNLTETQKKKQRKKEKKIIIIIIIKNKKNTVQKFLGNFIPLSTNNNN